MSQINLPQDVFERIVKMRSDLIKLTGLVGESAIVLERHKGEIKILEEEYSKKIEMHKNLEEDLRMEMSSVVEQYGEGSLDLDTGIYMAK